ncbi:MAG: SulP family inorganic anion transporter [Candidatus Pristimantibacillus lignocellulolyticus]|uniref:SulP family inorganic anion transporter n=1 Tax=Candidatus Pristimantibacillus lignocellulolyticus TaxID=2994561 RepID=A0A9J6ZIR5_9BACL|nr:MAG: SulP family inorganic anion transporter [Candidatus Pristimantibacillus lignocellulolyticus]
MLNTLRSTWFFNVRGDVLAGVTVALALIPEAIAFSIIAGVDPMVGIHASFCIAVLISIFGGRPGMISAATGAMSILMVTLVAQYGIEYLYATTILTGLIQYAIGALKLGKWISFVPQSVLSGFLNSLGIMVFMSQLQHFVDATWVVYTIGAVTLLIVYGLPYITKAIPSTLVAIVVMTIVTIVIGLDVKTVGDMGIINSSLPLFHWPNVPISWETLKIIAPVAVTMAIVGLLESLITATVLDEQTKTKSDKNKEVRGQGIANTITGMFGGMAGCAMIGQSLINVRSGGRGRLSTMVAGGVLLLLIVVLRDVVVKIPMPALAGVMIMVAISTFEWQSIKNIPKAPIADTMTMIVTVVVILITHNLAQGVLVGVLLSAVIFAIQSSRLHIITEKDDHRKIITYYINGPLFFATSTMFDQSIEAVEGYDRVVIDGSQSKVWDQSAILSLAKVVNRLRESGNEVELILFDKDSSLLVKKSGMTETLGA